MASSCASFAGSSFGLSRKSTVPAGISAPDSMLILSTTPEACAARSAPRTARRLPRARVRDCQVDVAAMVVDTVCGAVAIWPIAPLIILPTNSCQP